tara:strand:- start:11 stop:235 length:225 start_codon:yes stop_codon:yes gene_type:complete
MAEKKTNTIKINDVDYTEDQLTDQQKHWVNQAADLERKIRSATLNIEQLNVGKQAYIQMLTASLEASDEKVTTE